MESGSLGDILNGLFSEEKDLNSNTTKDKVYDDTRDSSQSLCEGVGLCSTDLLPSNTPKQTTLNEIFDLPMHQTTLFDYIEHKIPSISEIKNVPRVNKHRKALKSDNLRVCFASMNEELIGLDYQWSKVEEMLTSYEKSRKKFGRDLQQFRKDIEDLLLEDHAE